MIRRPQTVGSSSDAVVGQWECGRQFINQGPIRRHSKADHDYL